MAGPLDGIRVIDLTTVLFGPYCTQTLGDLGADVIKVEPPEGDTNRWIAPMRSPGMGAVFLNTNRNKRAVCLDLKQPAARDALLRLVDGADLFVHSIRPQAIARLGLDADTLRRGRERLIYAQLTGFASDGPNAGRPAYDDIIQAASGLADAEARSRGGQPAMVPSAVADKVGGLTALYGILAALFQRERTGKGQFIEVPMLGAMASFLMVEHLSGETFRPAEGPAGYPRVLAAHRKPHRTKDGRIAVLPYTTAHWQRFFRLAGLPQMVEDERVTDPVKRSHHVGELYALKGAVLAERTTGDWMTVLTEAEIPATPVQTLDGIVSDPETRAIGLFQEADHPSEGAIRVMGSPLRAEDMPAPLRVPARRLGEDTRDVLSQVGMDDASIQALFESGAALEPE